MKHTNQGRMCMALLCAVGLSAPAWAGGSGAKLKMMDSNGDGVVSSTEHAAAVAKRFAEMDANGDGNVSATEMDAGHRMRADAKGGAAKGPRMSSADKIAMMDTNADGMLSASEHDAGAQSMFAQMDSDGNGSLSQQEMAAGRASVKSAATKTTP